MMTVLAFPRADDGQLAAALDISHRVFAGECVSLAAMCAARDVIDRRTSAKATVALLNRYIAAHPDEARKGTIRDGLCGALALALFGAAVLVVVFVGGPM